MEQKLAQKILEKTVKDYQELAEEFSPTRIWPWKELEDLLKYVREGDRVLDLGCGNGRLYKLLQDRKIEYVGVDSSEKLIEIAEEKLKAQNSKVKTKIQNSKVRFTVGNALNLPFKENSFDLVFAIALLHQIPSEEYRSKVISEARRVLKDKGILILSVWNLFQPKLIFKYKIFRIIFGLKDVYIPWKLKNGQIINRYYHAFAQKELENLIKKSKLKIVESYFSKRGERTKWLKGYNLILISQKYD